MSNSIEKRGGRTQAPAQSGWAAWYAGREISERERAAQGAPATQPPKAPEAPAPQGRTPIVRARRVVASGGAQLLTIKGPFCGEKHVHGAAGPNIGDGDGPRVSLCFDTRLRRNYVIREGRTNGRKGSRK